MEKFSIIVPSHNNLEYLKLLIPSIRKNQSVEHELIVLDDHSTDGTYNWLVKNETKYTLRPLNAKVDSDEALGICRAVERCVSEARNELILYLHSDMVVGPDFDTELYKHWKKGTIVSATRIEPPLYPDMPYKHHINCGMFPVDFSEKRFRQACKQVTEDRTTEGVFVPYLFHKEDWIGYDPDFYPATREDSDKFNRWKEAGKKFITSRASLVYHFSGRAGRHMDNDLQQDNTQWKYREKKNLTNFVRKWGTTPLNDEWMNPVVAPKIPISATVLVKNEGKRMYQFLELFEPYFNEIIIVNDNSTDNTIEEIKRYTDDIVKIADLAKGPTNFKLDKIKVYTRELKGDFADQTNFATSKCTNDWVMKIDVDEKINLDQLNKLRFILEKAEKEDLEVLGFPRVNTLELNKRRVVVNDLPRNEWTEQGLSVYTKDLQEGQVIQPSEKIQNADVQWRLHKKDVEWINMSPKRGASPGCHEIPEPVANKDKEAAQIINDITILHDKYLNRQNEQNTFYDTLTKKKGIKNVIMNSVVYTHEGITRHARHEAVELKKLGYNVFLDAQPYKKGFSPDLKDCYDIFDSSEPFIYYMNQPPSRGNNPHMSIAGNLGRDNLVVYLAFEGALPVEWSDILNQQSIKKIFVPTNYVKECFEESGIKQIDRIKIIPHGVDSDMMKDVIPHDFDKFTFFAAGTIHNSRKGFDLLVKAFSEEFKDNDDVQLVLKLNKIYNPKKKSDDIIHKWVKDIHPNIKIIDSDISDEEMYSLMKGANCVVAPSRSEGFNIVLLEAKALGTPSIATGAHAHLDFCTPKDTLFIDVEKKLKWAPFESPLYVNSKWYEPKLDSLKEQMQNIYKDFDKYKTIAEKDKKRILKDWNWQVIAKKINKEFKDL